MEHYNIYQTTSNLQPFNHGVNGVPKIAGHKIWHYDFWLHINQSDSNA